jgi:hypothetical protein
MMDKTPEEYLLRDLQVCIIDLRKNKPEERNEVARRYAVTITELEKVAAYFEVYVVNFMSETASNA